MYRKSQDEPVVLTLSSDEDDSEGSAEIKNNKANQSTASESTSTVYEPLNPKEPIIKQDATNDEWQFCHQNCDGDFQLDLSDFQNSEGRFVSVQCRSVRIGSYKVVPNEKLYFSSKKIEATVPPFAEGSEKAVHLTFPVQGIRKILAHFGSQIPVFFVYVTDPVAKTIRKELKMNDENGFYFNPCSHEESQRRLTILPEKMQPDTVQMIKNMFKFVITNAKDGKEESLLFFEELTQKDANEILVRSSPVEIESLAINSRAIINYETKTLLVFPPPPNKGGITITMDDYCCLKEEQFLNDVLIDFFFKWLHMCHISDEDREKTHIFSTFFYKRLTTKPKNKFGTSYSEIDPNLNDAERRHARVQSWTKNVDIFSKDYILIPINEQSHWFLAVICFPYLDGPIHASTGNPVPITEATLPTRSSTRKKKKIEIPVIDDCDGSDRDEAEGDEFELEDDDDEVDDQNDSNRKQMSKDDAIKQPYILILDSLSGSDRKRIGPTLRDYLAVEFSKRKKKSKVFNRETMPGYSPKVPQQMNFSDCGIFILQFAQSFFENPLKDFRRPFRSLQNWFSQDVASSKRESVALLIKTLMDQYKPNHGIALPPVYSNPSDRIVDKIPEDQSQSQMELETCDQQDNSLADQSKVLAESYSDLAQNTYKIIADNPVSNNSSAQIDNTSKCNNGSLNNVNNSEFKNSSPNIDESKDAFVRTPKISASIKNLLTNANIKENTRRCSLSRNNYGNTPKAKPINSSLQLLCDNYTNDTEDDDNNSDIDDDDSIFISNKTKRFKMSPVES